MASKLSILICSLNSRKEKRKNLLQLLKNSIGEYTPELKLLPNCTIEKFIGEQTEIIICTDDKQMSVGAKRNMLISEATGEYTSFIDDDDMVSVDYVMSILNMTPFNSDVIVFKAVRYENGFFDREVLYGTEFRKDYQTRKYYFRLPNHLMAIKRSITSAVLFPEISFGEDSEWARKIFPYLKTQSKINEVLYEYWFDKKTTETQK